MDLEADKRGFRRHDYERAYRAEHPIALWLALGIGITGLLSILAPATFEQTSTSLALPPALRIAFDLSYAVGGFVMWIGLNIVRHRVEVAGEVLLSAALLVQYFSIIYVRPAGGISGLFILALAIGVGRRAWRLLRL